QQRQLDALWKELDFITLAPVRQFKQFIWFERAEPPSFMATPQFNAFRSEDDDVTSEAKMRQLADVYLAKAREVTNDVAAGVIAAEARRMLQDRRARRLATEFAGNWLDIRRFEEHNAVDRERFPGFTNELRAAMFEEPVRFVLDVIQRNASVLDFLYGDYTFVNAPLARHYGMPEPADGA